MAHASSAAIGEVGALLGTHSGRVLSLGESGQRSSLGSGHDSSVQTSVGITVRVVGARLGIHARRVLVASSSVIDFVCLHSGVLLGLGLRLRLGLNCHLLGSSNSDGHWAAPLTELILNVSRGKVPHLMHGNGVPLRLGRNNVLDGIPLGLRSNGRGSWSKGGGHSGNSVGVPQGVIVDGKSSGRLGIVQTRVITNRESRAERGIYTSRVLSSMLGRDGDNGQRHEGLSKGIERRRRSQLNTVLNNGH